MQDRDRKHTDHFKRDIHLNSLSKPETRDSSGIDLEAISKF